MARGTTVLLGSLTLAACSSSYVPAESPRIETALRGGYPTFYRDGKEYPSGVLLGGVEDAVRGNARAEHEARTANQLMVGGFVCEIVGVAALASGVALSASSHVGEETNHVGEGLAIGSIVAEIAALVLFMNAYPHMYDAVNIYNDGLTPVPLSPGPATAARASAPPTR